MEPANQQNTSAEPAVANQYINKGHMDQKIANQNSSVKKTEYHGMLSHILLHIVSYVWFAGMICLFAYCIFSYIQLKRRLQSRAFYGYDYRGICVYTAVGLDTPFVFGMIKPVIYMPADLSGQEIIQCLAHEYTHIRRKDYLIKQLAFLLVCIYWFQPFVWLAFRLMTKDMEMSCDEVTLGDADLQERKSYSCALLSLSCKANYFAGCPLAFGENNTSSRIKNIMNYRKPKFQVIAICTIIVLLCFIGLLTNPVNSAEAKSAQKAGVSSSSQDSLYNISSQLPTISTEELSTDTDEKVNIEIMQNQEKLQKLEDKLMSQREQKKQEILTLQFFLNYYQNSDSHPLFATVHPTDLAASLAVRSLPNDSAEIVDYLQNGALVDIVAFGPTVYKEGIYSGEFEETDMETMLDSDSYAAILYSTYSIVQNNSISNTDNNNSYFTEETSIKKGYVKADSLLLDISENTKETFAYWIGKAWCDAFCCRDGNALYQMAADKAAFLEWDMVNGANGDDILFGYSSPWPWGSYLITMPGNISYTFSSKNEGSDITADISVYYFAETSDPSMSIWRQELTLDTSSCDSLENITTIEDMLTNTVKYSELRCYNKVTDSREFSDAYVLPDGDLIFPVDNDMEGRAAATSSNTYRAPDTALISYLYLEGGRAELQTEEDYDGVYVEYSYSNDDMKFRIPMKNNGLIWVIDRDRLCDERSVPNIYD